MRAVASESRISTFDPETVVLRPPPMYRRDSKLDEPARTCRISTLTDNVKRISDDGSLVSVRQELFRDAVHQGSYGVAHYYVVNASKSQSSSEQSETYALSGQVEEICSESVETSSLVPGDSSSNYRRDSGASDSQASSVICQTQRIEPSPSDAESFMSDVANDAYIAEKWLKLEEFAHRLVLTNRETKTELRTNGGVPSQAAERVQRSEAHPSCDMRTDSTHSDKLPLDLSRSSPQENGETDAARTIFAERQSGRGENSVETHSEVRVEFDSLTHWDRSTRSLDYDMPELSRMSAASSSPSQLWRKDLLSCSSTSSLAPEVQVSVICGSEVQQSTVPFGRSCSVKIERTDDSIEESWYPDSPGQASANCSLLDKSLCYQGQGAEMLQDLDAFHEQYSNGSEYEPMATEALETISQDLQAKHLATVGGAVDSRAVLRQISASRRLWGRPDTQFLLHDRRDGRVQMLTDEDW